MRASDYIENDGLSYTTLWSIGCPFHCSYCGNTKFISNDPKYKRIRHPSARYIVDEVKTARAALPAPEPGLVSRRQLHGDPVPPDRGVRRAVEGRARPPVRGLRRHPELRQPRQVRAADVGGHEPHPDGHPERQPPHAGVLQAPVAAGEDPRRRARSTRRSRRSTTSPRPTTSSPTTRSRRARTCATRCSCCTTWSARTRCSSTR